MKRIMVGLDGSVAGMGALRWGANIATGTGADLSVVHASRLPYSEVSPDDYEKLLGERRDEVDEWIESTIGSDQVWVDVTEGDARSVIAEAVDRDAPDLLVVGRTGHHGAPGFLHVGSVVEYLAHEARVPLAVVPIGASPAIERIVLGVDGSPSSAAAVSWCVDVVPALGAKVIGVVVEEPLVEWTPSYSERNWRRDATRDLDSWLAPLTATGVEVELVAAEHLFPADGLLGVAGARRADLVVVGTRGAGGFLGLRFGGVAMKLLHRATMPLVLVPPADDA